MSHRVAPTSIGSTNASGKVPPMYEARVSVRSEGRAKSFSMKSSQIASWMPWGSRGPGGNRSTITRWIPALRICPASSLVNECAQAVTRVLDSRRDDFEHHDDPVIAGVPDDDRPRLGSLDVRLCPQPEASFRWVSGESDSPRRLSDRRR